MGTKMYRASRKLKKKYKKKGFDIEDIYFIIAIRMTRKEIKKNPIRFTIEDL